MLRLIAYKHVSCKIPRKSIMKVVIRTNNEKTKSKELKKKRATKC